MSCDLNVSARGVGAPFAFAELYLKRTTRPPGLRLGGFLSLSALVNLASMRNEVARGRSVLISSHLLDDLADLTSSFYFIEAGTLVEKIESSSQTLKQEYLDTYEGGE